MEYKDNTDLLNRADLVTYEADSQSKLMINALRVRFKHVDCKNALNNFQSERSRNSYSLG